MKSLFALFAFLAVANASKLDIDFSKDIGESRTVLSGLALNTTTLTVGIGAVAGVLLAVLFVASTQQAVNARKRLGQEIYSDDYLEEPEYQSRKKRFAPIGNFI